MRALVLVLALVAADALAAFDSEAWLRKREAMAADAARLRDIYAHCVKSDMPPAEDVVVPVESHPDGSLKVVINAKRAKYFATRGVVWAEGVCVRKYRDDGTLDAQIDARSCVVDRMSKSGWAEGAARFKKDKTTCTGEGVYFSSTNGYLKVYDKADIVSKDLKFGGLRP